MSYYGRAPAAASSTGNKKQYEFEQECLKSGLFGENKGLPPTPPSSGKDGQKGGKNGGNTSQNPVTTNKPSGAGEPPTPSDPDSAASPTNPISSKGSSATAKPGSMETSFNIPPAAEAAGEVITDVAPFPDILLADLKKQLGKKPDGKDVVERSFYVDCDVTLEIDPKKKK